MKKSHFLEIGDFWCHFLWYFGWDWGVPAILRQNPNKITILCGCGFGFKKFGLGQTTPHPPRWDKIPTLAEFFFKAPLMQKYHHIGVIRGKLSKECRKWVEFVIWSMFSWSSPTVHCFSIFQLGSSLFSTLTHHDSIVSPFPNTKTLICKNIKMYTDFNLTFFDLFSIFCFSQRASPSCPTRTSLLLIRFLSSSLHSLSHSLPSHLPRFLPFS